MLTQAAVNSTAESTGSSFSFQPLMVFIIIALVMASAFIRAALRKRRAQQASAPLPGGKHPSQASPHTTTLLNGVPLKSYNTLHGQQTAGFANERMRMEAELKRQLDALDTARRAGQVTAEEYAGHREAIFKKF